MPNTDATVPYGNPFGFDIVFVAPRIRSVGMVIDADTGEEFTDIGFTVESTEGAADANVFISRKHADAVDTICEAQRNRLPLVVSCQLMREKHPKTGRCWFKGSIAALGAPGSNHELAEAA